MDQIPSDEVVEIEGLDRGRSTQRIGTSLEAGDSWAGPVDNRLRTCQYKYHTQAIIFVICL
jgi:hypothetical protein